MHRIIVLLKRSGSRPIYEEIKTDGYEWDGQDFVLKVPNSYSETYIKVQHLQECRPCPSPPVYLCGNQ